jgi:DNA-binding XRE family transcriptional regulator
MLVVVKKHPIEFTIQGNIPEKYLTLLKNDYGNDVIIDEEENEYEPAIDALWYKELQIKETPGGNLRFYRKLHKMTQTILGEKLGVSKQTISKMEKGSIPISRETACQLGKILNRNPNRFM